MKIYRETDQLYALKEKMGFIRSAKTDKEKIFSVLPLPKLDYQTVNYHASEHILSLQRSQYVCVVDDIDPGTYLKDTWRKYDG